jgi:CubicO group peptidase (beta-lactamase class C family)
MNRSATTLLFVCAFAAPLAAQTDLASRIDAVVKQHLQKPGAVGLSVGVAFGGEVVAKGYGLADAEFDVAADAETSFRIGSITKQFTAALVLKQIEQGKVALDDALRETRARLSDRGQDGHRVASCSTTPRASEATPTSAPSGRRSNRSS